MLAINDEYIYLKIARALSSSEVQYFTSTLTRLEKVWYSVFAAWNRKSRVFEEKDFISTQEDFLQNLTSFAVSSTVSKTFMLFS